MQAVLPNTVCRHCGTALDALARRRGIGICGAAQCRHKDAVAHTAVLKQVVAAAAPDAARSQLRLRVTPTDLVWLRHCEPEMVAVTEDDRASHRAHLESVVADGMIIDRGRLAESTADDRHPQGARLCGQCRGRCCVEGAGWRAFTDMVTLSKWHEEHPGNSLADAVDAYVAMLPAEHVDGACLYQTAQGCAMPRERRADICNGYACDSLYQVQQAASRDPVVAVIAVTFHKDRVERAAVIDADAARAITLQVPATDEN